MTAATPYSTRLGIDRRRYPRARLVVFDGVCAECHEGAGR